MIIPQTFKTLIINIFGSQKTLYTLNKNNDPFFINNKKGFTYLFITFVSEKLDSSQFDKGVGVRGTIKNVRQIRSWSQEETLKKKRYFFLERVLYGISL